MLQEEAIWHNVGWQALTFTVHKAVFSIQGNAVCVEYFYCGCFNSPVPDLIACRCSSLFNILYTLFNVFLIHSFPFETVRTSTCGVLFEVDNPKQETSCLVLLLSKYTSLHGLDFVEVFTYGNGC